MTERRGGDIRVLAVWTMASVLVALMILALDRMTRVDWPTAVWPWVLMTLYALWLSGPAASLVALARAVPVIGRMIGPGFLRFWGLVLLVSELALAGLVAGVWLHTGDHGFSPVKLVSAFAVLLALVSLVPGVIYWGSAAALKAVPASCLRPDV